VSRARGGGERERERWGRKEATDVPEEAPPADACTMFARTSTGYNISQQNGTNRRAARQQPVAATTNPRITYTHGCDAHTRARARSRAHTCAKDECTHVRTALCRSPAAQRSRVERRDGQRAGGRKRKRNVTHYTHALMSRRHEPRAHGS